jgi:hypothetical protein
MSAVLANDIPPELGIDAIDSVRLHGIFRASDEVKAALAGRMK